MSITDLDSKNKYFFRIHGENIEREISKYDLKKLCNLNFNEDIRSERLNAFIHQREQIMGIGRSVSSMDWTLEEMMQVVSGGSIVPYPFKNIFGDCSRAITFPSKQHMYRGENQRFPKAVPSLIRKLDGYTGKERELRRCIAYARCWQFFHSFLWTLNITKYWEAKLSDVNYLALAQHYGFPTELLDITTNFLVALFFATCKYIPSTDSFQPLKQEDIDKNESSQWGYIFHTPAWTCDYLTGETPLVEHQFAENKYKPLSLLSGDLDNVTYQVGYQPFYRCHYQSGYIMPMVESKCLQKRASWEKLYFRQSEELSQKIFKIMKQGERVYPHEGLSGVRSTIGEIQNSTTFSRLDIHFIYEIENVGKKYFTTIDELLNALNGYDFNGSLVKIVDDPVIFSISKETEKQLNAQYDTQNMRKRIGETLRVKPIDQMYRDECCKYIYGKLI